MSATLFVLDFSLWYYSGALRGIVSVFLNFLWFTTHFFSMPLLLRTLFAPWKRMTDVYGGGGVEAFLETTVMNMMSRIVGVVVRVTFLSMGALSLICTTVLMFVVLAFWVLFPVFLAYGLFFSVTLLV